MSLKEIKALVARIHSDDDLRRRFASEPDGVLSQFKLTAKEKAAIRRAHLRVREDGTLAIEEGPEPLMWWLS